MVTLYWAECPISAQRAAIGPPPRRVPPSPSYFQVVSEERTPPAPPAMQIPVLPPSLLSKSLAIHGLASVSREKLGDVGMQRMPAFQRQR